MSRILLQYLKELKGLISGIMAIWETCKKNKYSVLLRTGGMSQEHSVA
jgi:hypothetical protein